MMRLALTWESMRERMADSSLFSRLCFFLGAKSSWEEKGRVDLGTFVISLFGSS